MALSVPKAPGVAQMLKDGARVSRIIHYCQMFRQNFHGNCENRQVAHTHTHTNAHLHMMHGAYGEHFASRERFFLPSSGPLLPIILHNDIQSI